MSTIDPATAPHGSTSTLLEELRDAIRGRPRDYTTGPLRRAIAVLAVPMVLEMLMQSVFSVVDVAFVAGLGDAAAVATIGVGESLLAVVFAVGLGLSMGTTATVARRIGEKDPDGAAEAAVQAIGLGCLIAAVLGGLGAFFIASLYALMGASDDVRVVGLDYGAWNVGGCGTILLLFLINAVFRGAGDAVLAMKALWLANLVNIALDPLLIYGFGPIPAMGVTGAAVASTIGRGLGVVLQLWMLLRGKSRVRIVRRHLVLHVAPMLRLLRVSGVGIFQFVVGTTSYVGLMRVLTGLKDDDAVAGYVVAVRIVLFVLLPAWGLGNAAATLVGQSLGAREPQRATAAAWTCVRYNLIFLGMVTLLTLAFAPAIVGLLTSQPGALAHGTRCLRILSLAYVPFAFSTTLMMAFNGAGDTTTPTWINLGCHWVLKIPLALVLAYTLGLGAVGVFIAIPAAEVFATFSYALLFRRGRWQTRRV